MSLAYAIGKCTIVKSLTARLPVTITSPGRRIALLAATVGVIAALAVPTQANALDPAEIGVFPSWAVAGSSGAYSATPMFPASAGFPATTVTSTGTTLAAPTGVSAFLGASTAFGAEYGSTRSQPYLNLAPAAGLTNSVTTISFASPPPAGWGFALGDVDADWSFIQAFAGPGLTNPVSVAGIGYQGSGNYCTNSPRPSTCGPAPYTDEPVWVTATETFDGITYTPGTLRGNSLPGAPLATRDTSGAYAWFSPSVPIQTLQIIFGVREGFPTTQLWLASPAPKVIVTGTVSTSDAPAGQVVPPATTVQVNDAAGTPLQGIDEQPLRVPVDPVTGAYSVELEQAADGYQLVVIPPAGYTAPAPIAVPGVPDDPATLTATAPPIVIAAVTPTIDPVTSAPVPVLAYGGVSSPAGPLTAAAAFIALGGVILLARRRRDTRSALRPDDKRRHSTQA